MSYIIYAVLLLLILAAILFLAYCSRQLAHYRQEERIEAKEEAEKRDWVLKEINDRLVLLTYHEQEVFESVIDIIKDGWKDYRES